MQSNLSLEQAPIISVPFRFFLTAPIFSFLAGLLVLYFGADVFQTRWSSITLAFTHLITLGFLSMIMCGALIQILPVLAGSKVPWVNFVSLLVHLLLTAGTLLLSLGFFFSAKTLLLISVFLLGGAFSIFIIAVTISLVRIKKPNKTVNGIYFAVFFLSLTIILGLVLVLGFIGIVDLKDISAITNIHLVLGLLGWVAILVIAVAYQVVPMFQLTPEYPNWMTKTLTWGLFIGLISWSGFYLLKPVLVVGFNLGEIILVLLSIAYVLFAFFTLRLQNQRKRQTKDITLNFWQLAMLSIVFAAIVWISRYFYQGFDGLQAFSFLLGVVILFGFAFSVVNGMLYKIVPFLTWFHLQHKKVALGLGNKIKVPNVKKVIPENWTKWQFALHLFTVLFLLLAIGAPDWFARASGLFIMLSSLALGFNILHATRVYIRVEKQIKHLSENNVSAH